MYDLIEATIAGGCCVLVVAGPVGIYFVVLIRSARRGQGASERPTWHVRWTLIDLVCLLFLLGLVGGFLTALRTTRFGDPPLALYVVFSLIAVALWAVGVRELSRAGIHESRRRAIVLGVVLPALAVGMIVVAANSVSLIFDAYEWRHPPCVLLDAAAFNLGMLVVVYLANVLVRRAVRSDVSGVEESDPCPPANDRSTEQS